MRHALLALLLMPLPAAAHDGVKNPDVKARMEVMKAIQDNTKVLGQMIQGVRPYDAAEAEAAAEGIRAAAPNVASAFEPQADDPKSEASAKVWQDFAAFEAEAMGLVLAAATLDTTSEAALKESFGKMGTACRSCHAAFKE